MEKYVKLCIILNFSKNFFRKTLHILDILQFLSTI